MNVFAVDKSPLLCARALDDKRLIKMILETAQILCTVMNKAAGFQLTPYRSTHANHPITLWADDARNFNWLLLLGLAYGEEYEYRFDKRHASQDIIEAIDLEWAVMHVETGQSKPLYPHSWCNAARRGDLGIDFAHVADTHRAYRLYLSARWPRDKRAPAWRRRNPPDWYNG